MDITYFTETADLYRINKTLTGDSEAFAIPFSDRDVTLQLSELTGRTKAQYCLETKAAVIADTADWFDTSAGYVSADRGLTFDTPVSYFRIVVENQSTSYKIGALQ